MASELQVIKMMYMYTLFLDSIHLVGLVIGPVGTLMATVVELSTSFDSELLNNFM